MGQANRVAAAARDNAEWCDAFCSSHRLPGAFAADAWTCRRRTPPGYPDAVTLRPGARPDALLARVDAGPECSVKDSFADVDLAPAGFEVLAEATWLWHTPPAVGWGMTAWREVTDEAGLIAWEAAWAAGPPTGLFRPELLAHARVRLLAELRDGEVRAGCVATRGTAGVVGVSNVFDLDDGEPWRGILAWVAAHAAGRAVVGYEAGKAADAAVAAGFEPVGALRIWRRPETNGT